ncbi:MAG: hypothetical protein R3C28_11355 [Pirellulaceae bacterium]
MEQTGLGEIIDQLQQQHTDLQTQKVELSEALAKVEGELARVEGAIQALRPGSKTKSKQVRPCANRDAVRDAVRSCTAEMPSLTADELKSVVGKRLAASGYSRSGLALRLKEVLQENEFAHALQFARPNNVTQEDSADA